MDNIIQVQQANRKREAPWIGIGTSGAWTDYRDALIDSKLDFEVEARDAKVEMVDYLNGSAFIQPTFFEKVPGIQVNVTKDARQEILGCVSSQYGIVQNEQAFSLLQPFTDAGGVITNAGMTEQGLVFMVLRMRRETMFGDDWDFDVMCTNSFNARFPCALVMVPTRIICQNMYRGLMGNSHDALLHVRHGSLAQNRLAAANKATAAMLSYIDAFGLTLQKAKARAMGEDEVKADLLPILFPYPKPGGDREQMSRERVDALRKEFMDVYYEAPDNWKFYGTGMGFLNAYYDYLSHRNPTKCMPGSWNDRRLSGLVSGNDVKARAITHVTN